MVTVDGGHEHPGGLGQLAGPQAHPVDLDMVGVAVVPVFVVGGEDLRVLGPQDGGQTGGRLLDIGLPEAARRVVGVFAFHPGVAVAQVFVTGHAQNGAGGSELQGSPLFQGLALVEEPVGDFTELSAGGGDEDDPVTGGGHLGHGAGGGDGLVVGVGMEEDGGGHTGAG